MSSPWTLLFSFQSDLVRGHAPASDTPLTAAKCTCRISNISSVSVTTLLWRHMAFQGIKTSSDLFTTVGINHLHTKHN